VAFRFEDDEPSRLTGYALSPLDRLGDRRNDAAFLAGLAARDDAGFILVVGDRPLIRPGDPPIAVFDRALARELGGRFEAAVFLGLDGATPLFALPVAIAADALPAPLEAGDLRALAIEARLPAAELAELAAAKSLVDWHRRHGFCANCGAPTELAGGGWRRECGACGAQHFPRTDPVVIMLAVDGERCVLGRQARFAPGMYSCLAGFVEPGETIEDAVRREVKEEAGIAVGRVRYVASQPWPFPSSLMIGCLAEAAGGDITMDESELEDCRWFERGAVRAMLDGAHPEGLRAPPAMAIAHRLMRLWAEG
jgi:NAD+ diphosphatase